LSKRKRRLQDQFEQIHNDVLARLIPLAVSRAVFVKLQANVSLRVMHVVLSLACHPLRQCAPNHTLLRSRVV
jgi:hypothetical protein